MKLGSKMNELLYLEAFPCSKSIGSSDCHCSQSLICMKKHMLSFAPPKMLQTKFGRDWHRGCKAIYVWNYGRMLEDRRRKCACTISSLCRPTCQISKKCSKFISRVSSSGLHEFNFTFKFYMYNLYSKAIHYFSLVSIPHIFSWLLTTYSNTFM